MENTAIGFEEAYKGYFEKLYRVAFRITGNKEDAEDALQEAYINAFKGFTGFSGKSSLSTWLYRITVNSSLRFIKKRNSFPVARFAADAGLSEAGFFESLKAVEQVEDAVLAADIRESCLQMFIECMPKKQRITFVLKVLMQLSVSEVASIMDISESAVKTNVYRARQLMKEHLEGKCSLIRPDNPCNCKLWTSYAIKYGRRAYIPSLKPVNELGLDYRSIFESELSFLSKLVQLYDNQPQYMSGEAFIIRMKELMAKGSVKLLD